MKQYILRKADTRIELMKMITVRQMKFLGHVNKKKKIEYLAMTRKLQGNEREVDKGQFL